MEEHADGKRHIKIIYSSSLPQPLQFAGWREFN